MQSALGEEVTIHGEGDIPATPAYAVLPGEVARGVVVLHEVFGRQPEIDAVVRRFGQAGYAAVAPDLFHGAPRLVCIWQALRAVASGQGTQIEQILLARRWLSEHAGIDAKRIGVIGFCMGGGFALAVGRGWGAVSTNYGDVPPAGVMRDIGPVIGCYGGRDRIFGKTGDRLRERLRPLGVEPEVHVYPEVGHSFLTNGHHPIAGALTQPFFHIDYNPAVAEDAWGKILAFFDQHLA